MVVQSVRLRWKVTSRPCERGTYVGPNLDGLIGRKTGSVADYSYSEANKTSGLTWDEATFKDYIANPRAKIPGTKMIFAGLPKESDRNNLFAYLNQFDASGAIKK